jgi:hypothetical protein
MDAAKFGKSALVFTRLMVLLSALIFLGGCSEAGKPRLRFGAFFGSPFGMRFTDPAHLGTHHFDFSLNETNGMVYTCKGGFIDIGHVREAADRTAYLKKVAYRNLIGRKTEFSFSIIEPSQYRVRLSYPQDWDDLSAQERKMVANELSIYLGQYLAHTSLIWHEIITWYGFASAGIFPDTISSFSWEDPYSDILGTWLAVQVLHGEQQYDDAITRLLDQTLKELGVQPAQVARRAAKQIEGRWYTGGLYFFVDMKVHNFEVGLHDGSITPVLVPGICPDAVPQRWPVPSLELLCQYGFNIEVEIEPRVLEQPKIYSPISLGKDRRIRPEVHFPRIMAQITKQENGSAVLAGAE